MNNTVTVDIDYLDRLEDDAAFLRALRGAGVDNWDGFDFAVELYEEGDTYDEGDI